MPHAHRRFVIDAGAQPFGKTQRELRRRLRQFERTHRAVAEQQHRGLVRQFHLAVAIHQQHTGTHAPDNQLVDLGQSRGFLAATVGEGLGHADALAELVAQRGDRKETHGKHHDFGERPRRRARCDKTPEVDARKRQRGRAGRAHAQAQRQQQCGRADIEQQHQCDARSDRGQHRRGRCGECDIDARADQRRPLHAFGGARVYQQRNGE